LREYTTMSFRSVPGVLVVAAPLRERTAILRHFHCPLYKCAVGFSGNGIFNYSDKKPTRRWVSYPMSSKAHDCRNPGPAG
jgi:hypothetical protein